MGIAESSVFYPLLSLYYVILLLCLLSIIQSLFCYYVTLSFIHYSVFTMLFCYSVFYPLFSLYSVILLLCLLSITLSKNEIGLPSRATLSAIS